MVLHKVFGVERDIDIAADVFPTPKEIEEMEAPLGEHQHGWFDSCIDGAKLHARAFLPKGKPKAVVIFMHGITANSGEALLLSDGRKTTIALILLLVVVFGAMSCAVLVIFFSKKQRHNNVVRVHQKDEEITGPVLKSNMNLIYIVDYVLISTTLRGEI